MAVLNPRKPYLYNRSQLQPANVYSRPAAPTFYKGLNGYGQALSNSQKQFEHTLRQMAVSPFSVNNESYMDRIRAKYNITDDGSYDTYGTIGGVVGAGVGYLYSGGFLQHALTDKKFWLKDSWRNPWTGRISFDPTSPNFINPRRTSIGNTFKTSVLKKQADDAIVEALKARDAAKATWDRLKHTTKKAGQIALDNKAQAKAVFEATQAQLDAAEAAGKVAAKGAGIPPWVGGIADLASFGFSIAGLKQSIDSGDTFNTVLNSIALLGDTASLVGDILEYTPLAPAGFMVSAIGGLVSAGVSALQGWMVGQTIGRSFSEEGAIAQGMFAQNLYAGMIQRPVTTLASTLTMVGVPAAMSALTRLKGGNVISDTLKWVGGRLTNTPLGNQIRAGVSMMALQGVSNIVGKIDEKLPFAPENPDDVSFVSAISLYGDINDNLYGATRNKAILLGLVSEDKDAMVKALARSWGYSDEMFYSVVFDDIRQAAGVDVGPLGNSVISIIGELMIDPQNFAEVAVKINQERVVAPTVNLLKKIFKYESAKAKMAGGKAEPNTIGKLVDDEGIFSPGKRISNEDLDRVLTRVVEAYYSGDEKALRDVVTDLVTSQFKGWGGTDVKVVHDITGNQLQILKQRLDDISKGIYSYRIGSEAEVMDLRNKNRQYTELKMRVARGEVLTDVEKELVKNLEGMYGQLKSIYGDRLNDITLLESFLGEFNLELSADNIQKLYVNYSDMRQHMDLSDAVAGRITGIANPVPRLIKYTKFGAGKLYEYARNKIAPPEKTQVNIISLNKLKSILDTDPEAVKTVNDMKEAQARSNAEFKTIETLIKEKDIDDKENPLVQDMSDSSKNIIDVRNKNIELVKISEQLLKEQREQLAEAKKSNIYRGATYTNQTRKKDVYISTDNVDKIEAELKASPYSAESNPDLSTKELDELLSMDIHSRDNAVRTKALDYRDTYNAFLDFKYHNLRPEILDRILAHTETAISLIDMVSGRLNNELYKVISAFNIFKRYVNGREVITKSTAITETTNKYNATINRLQKEKDALDKQFDKLKDTDENKAKRTKLHEDSKKLSQKITGYKTSITKLSKELADIETKKKANPDYKEDTVERAAFDGTYWNLLQADESKDVFEKVAPLLGNSVQIEVIENGVPVKKTVASLRTILAEQKTAPLQLEWTPSIQHALLGLIGTKLKILDIDLMLTTPLHLDPEFTKKWKEHNTEPEKQIDMLLDVIGGLKLDSYAVKQLYKKGVMLSLYKGFNTIINKGVATEYIQIADITDAQLKAIVYSNLYQNDTEFGKYVDGAMRQIALVNERVKTVLNDEEYKNEPYWSAIYKREMLRVNYLLKGTTAYSFMQPYLFPNTPTPAQETGIFISDAIYTEYLPKTLFQDALDKIKKEKKVYTAEDIIIQTAEAPATKELYESIKKDWAYIKSERAKYASEAKKTEKKAEQLRIADTRKAKQNTKNNIKHNTRKELGKVSGYDKFEQEDILNLVVRSYMNPEYVLSTPFAKKVLSNFSETSLRNLNKAQKKEAIGKLFMILNTAKTFNHKFGRISYIVRPGKFLPEGLSKVESYYDLKKRYNRTSAGHTDFVLKIAQQIVDLIYEYKDVKIDESKLAFVKKLYADETDAHILARRIAATYASSDKTKQVVLYADAYKNKENVLARLFKDSLKAAIKQFIKDDTAHPAINNVYYRDTPDEAISKVDAEDFIRRINDYDNNTADIVDARNVIFKYASELYNKALLEDSYSGVQEELTRLTDALHAYEQRDASALSDEQNVVNTDVVKRFVINDDDFVDFLDDIIALSSPTDQTIYKTATVEFLANHGKFVNEDLAHKDLVPKKSFIDYVYRNNTTWFKYVGADGKSHEIDLYTLMFKYKITSRRVLNNLLNAIDKNVSGVEAHIEARTNTLLKYNELLKKVGYLLSVNEMDPTLSTDTTEEDFDSSVIFNNLRTKDVLITKRSEGIIDRYNKTPYSYLPEYYSDPIIKLYKTAQLQAKKTDKSVQESFVELLFTPDNPLNKAQTIKLLGRIFFHNARVGLGNAASTKITKLEKILNSIPKDTHKYTVLNNRLERLIKISASYKHTDLLKKGGYGVDPEKLYNYLKVHIGMIPVFFNGKVDTDASEYLTVRDGKEHVLVKRSHEYVEAHADIGIPEHNIDIGEGIISKANKALRDDVVQAAQKSNAWRNGTAYEIKEVSTEGIIVVVPSTKDLFKLSRTYLNDLELKTTKPDALYFVTQKQYDAIKKMQATGDYVDEYHALYNPDGSIQGEVSNFINLSATDKINAYIQDLELLQGYYKYGKNEVSDVIDNVIKHATKLYDKPTMEPSYLESPDFVNTEGYKEILRDTKLNRAFIEFYRLIDPNGHMFKFNIDTIARIFFNNYTFKKHSDGSTFNVAQIEKLVDDRITYNQLKTEISIDGTSLLDRIKYAVTEMQKKYGDSDINFSRNDVLSDGYIDKILDLNRKISGVFYELRSTVNKTYWQLLPMVKADKKRGFITHITPEEISDRVKVVRKHSKAVRQPNGDIQNTIVHPYAYPKLTAKRDEYIKTLIKDFDTPDEDGFKQETNIYIDAEKVHKLNQERVRSINNSKKKVKNRNYLNLSSFYTVDRTLDAPFRAAHEAKAPHTVPIKPITLYDNTADSALRDYCKQAWVSYKALKDKSVLTDDERLLTRAIDASPFIIESSDDLFNFLRYEILAKYNIAIQKTLTLESKADIGLHIYMTAKAQGLEYSNEEFFALINAQYKANKEANKKMMGVNPKYRMFRDDITMEDFLVSNYFGYTDEGTQVGVYKVITEFINEYESYLFHGNVAVKHNELEDLEDTIPEFRSFKEYIDSKGTEKEKAFTEFMIYKGILGRKDYVDRIGDFFTVPTDGSNPFEGMLDPQFSRIVYNIINKRASKKKVVFERKEEMYYRLANPLLDSNKEFKEYVYKYFFTNGKDKVDDATVGHYMRLFGITTTQEQNLFNPDNNESIRDIALTLAKNKSITNSQYFAFIVVLDAVTKQFINDTAPNGRNSDGTFKKWGWTDAHKMFLLDRLDDSIDMIKGLQATNALKHDSTFENDIIEEVMQPMNVLQDALGFVSKENDKLRAIVLDPAKTKMVKHDAHPEYVTRKETNPMTIARNARQATYDAIFSTKEGKALDAIARTELLQLAGDVVLDSISEETARDIKDVGPSSLYGALRQQFTDIVSTILDKNMDKEFIKMREIGDALHNMLNNKDLIDIYLQAYRKHEMSINDPDTKTKYNAMINELVKFFKSKSYLVHPEENVIRAILGRILQQRGVIKTDSITDLVNERLKLTEKYISNRHDKSLENYASISYALTSTRNIDDILHVLYPDVSLDKIPVSDREEVEHALALTRFINSNSVFDKTRFYDTQDFAYLDKSDKGYQETSAYRLLNNHLDTNKELVATRGSLIGSQTKTRNKLIADYGTEDGIDKRYETNKNNIIELEQAIESNKQERIELERQLNNIKEDALISIVLDNLELIAEFIDNRNGGFVAEHNRITKGIQDAYDIAFKDVLPEYRDVFDQRRALSKEVESYRKTIEHKLYSNIKNYIKAEGANELSWDFLFTVYVDDAVVLNITSVKQFEKWYTERKEIEDAWADKLGELDDVPNVVKVDGSIAAFKQKEKNLNRALDIFDKDLLALEKQEDHTPKSIDDTDYTTMLGIAKEYVRKIVNAYRLEQAKNKDSIFKGSEQTELSANDVTRIKDKVLLYREALKEDITKKYKPALDKAGISVSINKASKEIDNKIATYKLENNLTKDDDTVTKLRRLKRQVENVLKKLDTNDKIIARLDDTTRVSKTEFLYRHTEKVFKDAGFTLTDDNMVRILDYLGGNTTLDSNTKISANRENAKTYKALLKDERAEAQMFEDYFVNRPASIEDLTKKITEQEKLIAKQKGVFEQLKADHKKIAPSGKLTNIGLFMDYYGVKNEEEALTKVMELSEKNYNDTDGSLMNAIKSAGDYELHNPIVDVLITRLNAMHQRMLPKEFVVFDMETLKDDKGYDTPYLLAMLKQTGDKFTVTYTYLNNQIFFDEVDNVKGKLLEDFYTQQREIMAKQYKKDITNPDDITWMNKKTDALVKKIKGMTNNMTFVETFIREFSGTTDYPIIAHNGVRFDFPNFETSIQNYGKRILANLYHKIIRREDINTVKARVKDTTLYEMATENYSDEMIKEFENVISKIIYKIDTKQPVTQTELNKFKRFNEALATARIMKVIVDAEESTGVIVEESIKQALLTGEDSEFAKFKKKLLEYFSVPADSDLRNKLRNNLIQYFEEGYTLIAPIDQHDAITLLVNDIIIKAEQKYNALLSGLEDIDYSTLNLSKGRRASYLQTIKDNYNVEEERETYNMKDALINVHNMINEIDYTVSFLKSSGADVNATIESLTTTQKELDAEIVNAKKAQKELSDKIDELSVDRDKITDEILAYAKQLQKTFTNTTYWASRAISTYGENAIAESREIATGAFSAGLLRIELTEQLRHMQEAASELNNMVTLLKSALDTKDPKAIEAEVKKLADSTYINQDILKITSIKERDEKIKEYELAIKNAENYFKIADTTSNELVLDSYFKFKFDTMKQQANLAVISQYKKLKELWNSKTIKDILDKDWIKLDLTTNEMFDIKNYNTLMEKLLKHKEAKDNPVYQDVRNRVHGTSAIANNINVATLNPDTISNYQEFKELMKSGIQNDITMYKGFIDTLNKMDFKGRDESTLAYEIINSTFTKYLDQLKVLKDTSNILQREDLYNIIQRRGKRSQDMTKAEFMDIASSTNEDILEAVRKVDKNVERYYRDAREFDDKFALQMNPYNADKDYIYRTELLTDSGNIITISVYDDVNDVVQQFSFNEESPESVNFNLKFIYSEYGHELVKHPAKILKFNNKQHPPKVWLDNFWSTEKGVVNRLNKDIVYKEDGTHIASYESIKKLIEVYSKYTSNKGIKIEDIRKDSTLDVEFDIKKARLVNMSDRMKQEFYKQLDIMQYAKRGAAFNNITSVYAGIANKIMSRFNSLVPGKVLNMIPTDYSIGFVFKYDQATLNAMGISQVEASEGSAGSSFMLKSLYTTDVAFTQNTAPIRTVLSNNKLYMSYTSLGITNKMFKLEKEFGNTGNIMDHFDKLTGLSKGVRDMLRHVDTEGNIINAFTPNILTEDEREKYDADILHKVGINATVAFANDPRAHEDTILIDRDYAKDLGWDEGNKTWLGLYGFKGAVKYVDGLYKQYGAMFVAKADSVKKRGAGGALLELGLNNVRMFLLGDIKGIDKETLTYLEAHKTILEKLFKSHIKKGKLIVDAGIDYEQLLATNGINHLDLVRKTLKTNVTISYYEATRDAMINTVVDKTVYYGEMYVILDSDNSANHKATKVEVNNKGDVTTVIRDPKGGVRGGVVVSPSVMNIIEGKLGEDATYAFPKDETRLELYASIRDFGVTALLKKYKLDPDGKKRTDEELVEVIEQEVSNKYAQYVLSYLMYKKRSESKNSTDAIKEFSSNMLYDLDLRAKQEAQDSLVGIHGAYYKAQYHKHEGIRQQMVANTSLRLGEIKVSREGFETLLAIDPTWLQKNGRAMTESEVEDFLKHAPKNDDAFAQYVENQGVYGYVMAIRSPVQDYAAVPMVKIMGVTTHKAVEANAYIYKMMGGDNDGDTIGMVAINNSKRYGPKNQTQFEYLKNLDATDRNYYDTVYEYDKNNNPVSYFQSVEKDFKIEDAPVMDHIDARYTYVGKKAFTETYVDDSGRTKEITIRDHYTWDELYLIAYGESVRAEIETISKQAGLKEPIEKFDKILYHQTSATFDQFDIDSFGAGALDHRTPRGVFLKPTDAKLKDVPGDKQYKVGVNIKKTLKVETPEDLEVFLTTNSAEAALLRNKKLALEKQLDDYNNFKTQEDYRKAEEEYYEVARLLRTLYNNVLKNLGYDSVHMKKDVSTDGEVTETWIVLDSVNTKILKPEQKILNVFDDLEMKKLYMNVLIREETGGENYNDDYAVADYEDKDKINEFYEAHKHMMWARYIFAEEVRKNPAKATKFLTVSHAKGINDIKDYRQALTEQERESIKDISDDTLLASKEPEHIELKRRMAAAKLYSQILNNTIIRIQVSKRGINIFGGGRKQQFVASLLSSLAVMNEDSTGNNWNEYRTSDGIITVESLAKKLTKLNNEKLFNLVKTAKDAEDFYIKLPVGTPRELADIVYNNYRKALKVENELSDITDAYATKDEHAFVQALAKTSKASDPILKNIIERMKNKDEVLTKADMVWIKTLYFGRFISDADDLFKSAYKGKDVSSTIKALAEGYINQQIIDRRAFKEMSRNATKIIAVAKHFGIDIDATKFLQRYSKTIQELTELASVRHVAIDDDHDLSMAIAMDYNAFDKNNVRLEDAKLQKIKDDYNDKYTAPQLYSDSYIPTGKFEDLLDSLIIDNAKAEFFNMPAGVPAEVYKEVEKAVTDLFKAMKTNRNMNKTMNDTTVTNAVKVLQTFNIPAYRVLRVLLNSYTMFRRVNDMYYQRTGESMQYKDKPYLEYGVAFYEVMYNLQGRQNRAQFEADYKKQNKRVTDYFLNTSELDTDLLMFDEDTGATSKVSMDDLGPYDMFTIKDHGQEGFANLFSADNKDFSPALKNLNPIEKILYQDTMDDLELLSSKPIETFESVLENITTDFVGANNIYKAKALSLKQGIEGARTEDQIKLATANKFVSGYHNYAQPITALNRAYNNRAKLVTLIKIKEKELQQISATLYNIDKQIGILTNKEFYLGTIANKDAIIERLGDERKQYVQQEQALKEQAISYALSNNMEKAIVLLHTKDGKNIYNLYKEQPKYLKDSDVNRFLDHKLMTFAKYQTPFLSVLDLYKIGDDYDWKGLFEWYKNNRRFNRLTVVIDGFDNETLLKRLNDYVALEDEEWNKASPEFKAKYKNRRAHYKKVHFNSEKDLAKFVKEVTDGKEAGNIIFNKKTYRGFDKEFSVTNLITPTLKEIDIRSWQDLKKLFEYMQQDKAKELLIGFVDLNNILDAMEDSYKPFMLSNDHNNIVSKLQYIEKLLMRFSFGFLFRNIVDTWNQLASEMYMQKGLHGFIMNNKEIVKYFGMTMEIDSIYKAVSEERVASLTDIHVRYTHLLTILNERSASSINDQDHKIIVENFNTIYDKINSYVDLETKLSKEDKTKRISTRANKAKNILLRLSSAKAYIDSADKTSIFSIKNYEQDLENAVRFLLDTRFAEYFIMYNALKIGGDKDNKFKKQINNVVKKHQGVEADDLIHILFEISAFMQTNAQLDVYRQESYVQIRDKVNKEKLLSSDDIREYSYEDLVTKLYEEKHAYESELVSILKNPIKALFTGHMVKDVYETYNRMNSWIERTGRIAGYLYDRYMYGYTFNETVNRSLKRFFNYGQRAPIEMQMIADIPYLSFPIRSIDNWLERLTDPKYMVLMSDVLDGIYGQYADEDGQYNEFTQFQIQNGWVPITNKIGLRLGHGAFDVQNILSGTSGQIAQRTSPLLRGISTLVQTKDMVEAMKQLAVTGVLTRAINTVAPRQVVQSTPVLNQFASKRPRSIGTTFNFTFDQYNYKKYVPYQYRNNGRYKRYENLYRDWFTKYGRMRVPKVDPLSIVKDIQWKQYVRYRRSMLL